jgi:hypothetical protein
MKIRIDMTTSENPPGKYNVSIDREGGGKLPEADKALIREIFAGTSNVFTRLPRLCDSLRERHPDVRFVTSSPGVKTVLGGTIDLVPRS